MNDDENKNKEDENEKLLCTLPVLDNAIISPVVKNAIKNIEINNKKIDVLGQQILNKKNQLFQQAQSRVLPIANSFNLSAIEDIGQLVKRATKYMTPLLQIFSDFKEMQENTHSSMNFTRYQKELEKYYWALPYKMDKDRLLSILNEVNSEKEFDDFMKSYFTIDVVNSLFEELNLNFSGEHKMILEQSEIAFNHELYAIANMALYALIDNKLSILVKNKRIVKRKGILVPILESFNDVLLSEINLSDLLVLTILSNNIDKLFESKNFSNYEINTIKSTRRHLTQHGVSFSNEKIECLMLFNTLYNIVEIMPILENFVVK